MSIEKEMLDQKELTAYERARKDVHNVDVTAAGLDNCVMPEIFIDTSAFASTEKDNQGMYGTPSHTCTPVPPKAPSETQVGGAHYKDFKIQPSMYIYENKLGWLEGNVIKYTSRHHVKNGVEDIEKAIHYLQLIKEWHYGS